MGGYNSGRWHYHDKAATVKEYSHISSSGLPAVGQSKGNSVVMFTRERPDAVSVVWYGCSEFVEMILAQTVAKIKGIPYRPPTERLPLYRGVIGLSFSPRYMGGGQWYFICPHCQRQALKLYWRYSHFACRTCQGLTYQSCQCSHEYDRGAGYLGLLKRAFLYEDKRKKIDALLDRLQHCRRGSKASIRLRNRIERTYGSVPVSLDSTLFDLNSYVP